MMKALRGELHQALVGREQEVDILLTALLARQHAVLLGPPGTAKSLLVKLLSDAMDCSYFELLFTAFTVPDEVFGPFDIAALQRGERPRKDTKGFLPEAEMAFLDECFKANSGVLNALLTALNERKFDNAGERVSIPLRLAVGASNEYPADESLAALYDRFMLRAWVEPLGTKAKMVQLLQAPEPSISTKLTLEQLAKMQATVAKLPVPVEVMEGMAECRIELAKEGISISDRRFRASLRTVQAHAFLEGRAWVGLADLVALADCWWDKHDQRPTVLAKLTAFAAPVFAKAQRLYDAAYELYEQAMKAQPGELPSYISKLQAVESRMCELKPSAEESAKVGDLKGKAVQLTNEVAGRHLAANPSIRSILGRV